MNIQFEIAPKKVFQFGSHVFWCNFVLVEPTSGKTLLSN